MVGRELHILDLARDLVLLAAAERRSLRGIRQATNDDVYICAGSGIYVVNSFSPWTVTLLGSITTGLTTPVSMQDNTKTLFIVDGSANGWTVDLASDTIADRLVLDVASGGGIVIGRAEVGAWSQV